MIQIFTSRFGIIFGADSVATVSFLYKWGFIPRELSTGISYVDMRTGMGRVNIESIVPTSMTLITSTFLHGGGTHFLGNMLFLWVFGDNVEHRLGTVRYLLLYICTGIVAGLTHYLMNPNSGTVLVGASGAISGIMGAYILLFPSNRVRVLFMVVLITVMEIRALYVLGLWFLWQALQGLLHLGMSSSTQIAFMAHVGGFISGMILVSLCTTVLFNRR
tara:strand:- start:9058 stop:9711 length:654 start_codon:yes stop_codon:yes gene_type:complete